MASASSIDNATKIPTVGYFPTSFPRDPVEINIYLEHLLVGQILEPLVESGQDGSITPAVASRWTVSNDAKEIHFFIREGLTFSNGKPVMAEDVKYTLERHQNSKNSQSKSYLGRIKKMTTKGEHELIILLETPYVAIFKALTRDQLGIVPKGFVFDKSSNEPFIGTGPYRAIKSEQGWFLKLNTHYRNIKEVAIPEWKVLFNDPKGAPWTERTTADLIPFATEDLAENLVKTKQWEISKLIKEDVIHFFQTTVWWYPHGHSYTDVKRRSLGAMALAELVKLCAKKSNLITSTGVIPEGIAGHLGKLQEIKNREVVDVRDRQFVVAAMSRDFKVLNSRAEIEKVEKQLNVKLKLVEIDVLDLAQLPAKAPDMLALSYAGGFQDPEGFLTVITASLSSDLPTIFHNHFQEYQIASSVLDWNKRSNIYQALNKTLVESGQVVPGWKLNAFRYRSPKLLSKENNLRYSAKLKDFSYKAD